MRISGMLFLLLVGAVTVFPVTHAHALVAANTQTDKTAVETVRYYMADGDFAEYQIWVLGKLRAHDFTTLDTYFSGVQTAYEQGVIDDVTLDFAFSVFRDNRTVDDETHYDQWVTTSPGSYPALLARATYHFDRGWDMRGSTYAQKVPPEMWDGFYRELVVAMGDLVASTVQTKTPILSYALMISITQQVKFFQSVYGRPGEFLTKANALDPQNYVARASYLTFLRPRWGGTYPRMEFFIEQAAVEGLSAEKLNGLRAEILIDKAALAYDRMDSTTALPLLQQATKMRGFCLKLGCMHDGLKDYAGSVYETEMAAGRNPHDSQEYGQVISAIIEEKSLYPADKGFYLGHRGHFLRTVAFTKHDEGSAKAAWADFEKGMALKDAFSTFTVASTYCEGYAGFVEKDEAKCKNLMIDAARYGSPQAADVLRNRWQMQPPPPDPESPAAPPLSRAGALISANNLPPTMITKDNFWSEFFKALFAY